ncbi:hypothetical protein Tco_1055656 [Tanacetum coccineum]|uniref:Uncharacterized protein n=1 Tax=Tanacetum coccineum TaxID=301880 RepID=A0ABQ5H1I2_9ASTR
MVPPNNLGPDLAGKSVNETSYRGMIMSLMYLTETRPDIQFSTVLCVRYQSYPKESHLITVKRILMYLKEKEPQVPAKYLVENGLLECQETTNFLREFWSTVVAFDPFPSTDEPEKRPLREFIIKFSVLNGQRPLTLDFKTFCSTTGLDYNNGKLHLRALRLQEHSLRRENSLSPKSHPLRPRDIISTTPDEGMAKTTPHPEGSLVDKNSGGNIPHANMEPIHNPVANPSGTGAKYQVDETQFTRLSDEEEVLAAGDDIDEDPQDDATVRTPSPDPTQPEPSYVQESASVSSSPDLKKFNNTLPLTESLTPTLALTHIPANVEGTNGTHTTTEETPSHTEGETGDTTMAIPKSSIHPTEVQPTHDQPITSVISYPESSHATPRIDKGKGIATESDEDPSKRVVPASTIIRPGLHEPVRKMKKDSEEAKLLDMSRPEVIKVVQEEAENIRLDLRKIISAKADFGITELDELGLIIQKKKNSVVKDLVTSLSKRYEILKKFPEELGIQSTLPAPVPEQASSQSSGRRRNHMELKPQVKVPRLKCNRRLPKGVPFFNHMVIKEPEYGIFFIDVFGDQAFQRWDDIHKVGVDSFVSYLVMASMVKTEENAILSLKLRKMIADHPD